MCREGMLEFVMEIVVHKRSVVVAEAPREAGEVVDEADVIELSDGVPGEGDAGFGGLKKVTGLEVRDELPKDEGRVPERGDPTAIAEMDGPFEARMR